MTLASQEQLIPFVLAARSIYAAAGCWLLFDAVMPAVADLVLSALFLDHLLLPLLCLMVLLDASCNLGFLSLCIYCIMSALFLESTLIGG